MGTYKETWDNENIYRLYRSLKKGAKAKKFMYNIFYNILEHDMGSSHDKARESIKHFPQLKKSIMEYGKAVDKTFDKARKDLIAATRNSDKY